MFTAKLTMTQTQRTINKKYNNLFVTDSKAQVAREERRWNTYKLKLL
jgi:hypothetical protein